MKSFVKTYLTIFAGLAILVYSSAAIKDFATIPRDKEVSSIVRVENPSDGAFGTAFIVAKTTEATFFLTNAHVCSDNDNVVSGFLYLEQNGDAMPTLAHAVGVDFIADLCLVHTSRIYEAPALVFSLGNSIGTEVKTIGYPGGDIHPKKQTGLYFSMEKYVTLIDSAACGFSSDRKCVATIPMGIFRNKVVGGQSGSPVLDINGEVVGIISRSDRNNTGLFVVGDIVLDFLQKQFN